MHCQHIATASHYLIDTYSPIAEYTRSRIMMLVMRSMFRSAKRNMSSCCFLFQLYVKLKTRIKNKDAFLGLQWNSIIILLWVSAVARRFDTALAPVSDLVTTTENLALWACMAPQIFRSAHENWSQRLSTSKRIEAVVSVRTLPWWRH